MAEPVHDHFDRAGQAADRIAVARIGDQRGMDQRGEVQCFVAPCKLPRAVIGQPA